MLQEIKSDPLPSWGIGVRAFIIVVALFWATFSSAAVSEWVPFESHNGLILMPITIYGEEARALLDSGAAGGAVSEHFLSQHEGKYSTGQQITLEGINSQRQANLINDVRLGIFGVEFELDRLYPVQIEFADFVIGMPFFDSFILQIDYPNKRLRIIEHGSLDLKSFANVKLRRAHASPQVKVQVEFEDEYKPWLLFDTGSNGGVFLQRSKVDALGWLEKYSLVESKARGVNKTARVERFNVPLMSFGPYELENVIVTVPAAGEATNINRIGEDWVYGSRRRGNSSDGILGYDVLKHFVVTLDLKHKLMHIEAPPP